MKTLMKGLVVMALLCVIPFCEVRSQERPPIYDESFETAYGILPAGWKNTSVVGSVKWTSFRGGLDGSVCMAYEASAYASGDFNMLVSPAVEVGNGLMLSFDYKCEIPSEFAVYLSFDGGVTFGKEPLGGYIPASKGWAHAEYELPDCNEQITVGFMAKGDKGTSALFVYLDNVKILPARRCAYPVNISLQTVAADNALVAWEYGNVGIVSEVAEYELYKNGQLDKQEKLENFSAQMLELNGLTPNTAYSFRMRYDCTFAYKGMSEWSESIDFTTVCGETQLPIAYNFDTMTVAPTCWNAVLNGEMETLSISSLFRFGQKGRSLEVKGDREGLFLFSDAVAHKGNDLEVAFYAYNSNDAEVAVEIGLQSDILNVGTFDKLGEYVLRPKAWTLVVAKSEATLHGEATGLRAAVWFKQAFTSPLYIDNFEINTIPSCLRPSGLNIEKFDHTSANLKWSVSDGASLLVYSVDGNDTTFLQKITSAGDKLTGLQPSTDYELHFRAECAGVKSGWSPEILNLHTACGTNTEFPLSEDFEEGVIPECWNMIPGMYGVLWEISALNKYEGNYAVRFNNSNSRGGASYLTMPEISIASDKKYQVAFYMHRDAATPHMSGTVNVYVNDTAAMTEEAVKIGTVNRIRDLYPRVKADGWYKYEFDIPKTGNVYVIFEGLPQGVNDGLSLYLDNIEISEVGECPRPSVVNITGVTSNSCMIEWTKRNAESEWTLTYKYGDTENTVTVKDPFYEVTGLADGTNYDFDISVAATCAPAEIQNIQIAFKTECVAKELVDDSYVDDLSANNWNCWKVLSVGKYDDPGKVGAKNGELHLNGSHCLVAMPSINISDITKYRVVFDYRMGNTYSDKYTLEVGLVSADYNAASFVPFDTITGIKTNTYSTYFVSFDNYKGTVKNIAFRYSGETNQNRPSYIDNVTVVKNPQCEDVFNHSYREATNVSGTFVLPGTSGLGVEAEYGDEGFELGEGSRVVITNHIADTVVLEGLDGNTVYGVYFRTFCGADKYGKWSEPITFQTNCNPIEVVAGTPVADGFENDGRMGCWDVVSEKTNNWILTKNVSAAYEGEYCMSLDGSMVKDVLASLYYPVSLKKDNDYYLSFYTKLDVDPRYTSVGAVSAHLVSDMAGSYTEEIFDVSLDIEGEYVKVGGYFTPKQDVSLVKISGIMPGAYPTPKIKVDNFRVMDAKCRYPENAYIAGCTDTTAVLEVNSFGESWNLKVSSKKINPATDEADILSKTGITARSQKIEKLQANTVYYYYLQSVCSDGVSEWTDVAEFTTMCGAQNVPYTQNFDAEADLDCWTVYENGEAAIKTSVRKEGAAACELSTATKVTFMSPKFNIESLADYMLNAYVYSSVDNVDVIVGVMLEPGDFETYLPVATINIPAKQQWIPISLYFNNKLSDPAYSDFKDAKFICLTYSARFGAKTNVYIDALQLNSPADCPNPVLFKVNELYETYASVSWESYKPSDFKIEVTENGVVIDTVTTNENMYVFEDNLKPSTEYTLRLWADCGNGSVSETSQLSFTTECTSYPLPIIENFNNVSTDRLVPACWDNSQKTCGEYTYNWSVQRYLYGEDKSPYIKFVSHNKFDGESLLRTPKIDLTGVDDAFISFKCVGVDSCVSLIASTDGKTFTDTIASKIGSDKWADFEYSLKKYAGQEIYLGFYAIDNIDGVTGVVEIDDIYIDDKTDCSAPDSVYFKEIKETEVSLTVKDDESTAWEVAWGYEGLNIQDCETKATGKEISLSGLEPGTEYQLYVRAVCGDKKSRLYGPLYFVTNCKAESLPYNYGFEDVNSADELFCFEMPVETEIGHNTVINGMGTAVLKTSMQNFVLPSVDADIENVRIEYKVKAHGSYAGDRVMDFEIGLVHKDSLDKFIPVQKMRAINVAKTFEAYFDLAGRTGKDYRIALRADIPYNTSFFIDDISVTEIPAFFKPIHVEYNTLRDTSVVVEWVNSKDAVGAELMLNNDETKLYTATEDGKFVFTDLTPGAFYSIKVRGVKGEEKTEWSDSLLIRTLHAPAVMPMTCGFEADDAETSKWMLGGNGKSDWTISTEANAIYKGQKSLYVNVQGWRSASHSYRSTVPADVFAYRTVKLEKDIAYNLSFVYHVDGLKRGAANEYMSVYLAPVTSLDTRNVSVADDWTAIEETMLEKPAWTQFREQITVENTGYYHLVFNWVVKSEMYGPQRFSAAIDEFSITEVDCSAVRDIEVDSVATATAKVTWKSDNREGVRYEYAVFNAGEAFDEITAVKVEVAKDTAYLTGLQPGTSYELYIRSLCTNGSYSDWTKSAAFTTRCLPVVLDAEHPFVDGFEYGEDAGIGCWLTSDDNWERNSDASLDVYYHSGTSNMILPSGSSSWLAHSFNMKKGVMYRVSFYARQSRQEYNGTKLTVAIGNGDMPEAMTTVEEFDITNSSYVRFFSGMAVPEDGVYTFGVRGDVAAATSYLSFDSLVIEAMACAAPAMFEVKDVTLNSAELSWLGASEKYNVIVNGGGLYKDTVVMGNGLKLTGLNPSTRYVLDVKSVCSETEMSDAVEFAFNTLCGGATVVPFIEDFNATTEIPSCWSNAEGNVGDDACRWQHHIDAYGNGMMRFDSHNSERGAINLLKSPLVHIADKGTVLSFDYKNTKAGEMSIMVMTAGELSVVDTIVKEVTNTNDWVTLSVSLDKYVGKDVMLVVSSTSNNSVNSDACQYIDNVRIANVEETVTYNDTICYGEAYTENGFDIPATVINYGLNTFTRVEMPAKATEPAKLYRAEVFVPNTDYYITDYIETGKPYNGNGFENIMSVGSDYVRTEVSKATGCDSVVHLTLLEMVLEFTINKTICEGGEFEFCGEKLTASGTFTCVKPNSVGKDSTTTLILEVLPKQYEIFDTICQGDFREFNNIKYEETGVYIYEGENHLGCDSIVNFHLEVIDSIIRIDTVICQGNEIMIEDVAYTKTGDYRIPLHKAEGECGQTVLLSLTATKPDTVRIPTHACEGHPLYFDGFAGITVTKDSVLYRTDKTESGCDSVTELTVTFIPTVNVFDTVAIKEGEFYEYDGGTLSTSGDYTSSGLTEEYQCDSIHHLHLQVTTAVGGVVVKELIIAPNPIEVNGIAYVEGEFTEEDMVDMYMEITDASGRLVRREALDAMPVTIEGLNVSGMYYVMITNRNALLFVGKLTVK